MTFRAWLRLQEKRQDPVGDLARDAAHDPDLKYKRDMTEDYLHAHRACDGTIDAYRQARREWREETKQ